MLTRVQNWPAWLKWAVLLQVSFTAFLGPFNCAVVNPSLVVLSKAMGVDPVTAAYNTTTAIIIGGVAVSIATHLHSMASSDTSQGFFFLPLTNVYGRRPILLLCISLAVIGSIGSAMAPNFSTLVGVRVITGVGISSMMAVGTAVVNDMFFLHERGLKTGVYTVFLTNGAHTAVLCKCFCAAFFHVSLLMCFV